MSTLPRFILQGIAGTTQRRIASFIAWGRIELGYRFWLATATASAICPGIPAGGTYSHLAMQFCMIGVVRTNHERRIIAERAISMMDFRARWQSVTNSLLCSVSLQLDSSPPYGEQTVPFHAGLFCASRAPRVWIAAFCPVVIAAWHLTSI